MVSALDSGLSSLGLSPERSGFEPWPGTLCCVLGQDSLLSQCLSPPRAGLFEGRLTLTKDKKLTEVLIILVLK